MSKQFDMMIDWMYKEGYWKFANLLKEVTPAEREAFTKVFLRQGIRIFHLTKKWAQQIHTVEDVRAKLQNWIERKILLESELVVDPLDSDSGSQVHPLGS